MTEEQHHTGNRGESDPGGLGVGMKITSITAIRCDYGLFCQSRSKTALIRRCLSLALDVIV